MTETEIWKPVAGFEEFYHVSNLGRMKSFRGKKERIVRGGLDGSGYYQVWLGNKFRILKHRLIAQTFHEQPGPEYRQVNHIDGCKTNNRADNLEWCTLSMNIQHAHDIGLHKRLTEEKVLEIRRIWEEGNLSYVSIGKMFNISQRTVSAIIQRKTWKHI